MWTYCLCLVGTLSLSLSLGHSMPGDFSLFYDAHRIDRFFYLNGMRNMLNIPIHHVLFFSLCIHSVCSNRKTVRRYMCFVSMLLDATEKKAYTKCISLRFYEASAFSKRARKKRVLPEKREFKWVYFSFENASFFCLVFITPLDNGSNKFSRCFQLFPFIFCFLFHCIKDNVLIIDDSMYVALIWRWRRWGKKGRSPDSVGSSGCRRVFVCKWLSAQFKPPQWLKCVLNDQNSAIIKITLVSKWSLFVLKCCVPWVSHFVSFFSLDVFYRS